MKCDLHVHTIHSGMCSIPVLRNFCRESYTEPEALYETLKHRGMDLVTVTDHDSIDAAESLRRHPDFFLSEEVTCTLPVGTEAHIGVYDFDERQHIELQRRRDDFTSFVAYLAEQRLFYSVNHLFSAITGKRTLADLVLFEELAPAFEVLNGAIPPCSNRVADRFAAALGACAVGGSDAHTLAQAGRTWTQVEGAGSKAEFFASLRAGRAEARGVHGAWWTLTADVLRIGCELVRSNPWTAPLAPLTLLVPLITALNYARELVLAGYWARRWQRAEQGSEDRSLPVAAR